MKLQRPSSRLKFHEQSTLLGSTVFFSATSSSVPISPTPSGIIFIHSTTSGTKIIFITASGSRRRKKNRPIVEIEFLEIDEIFCRFENSTKIETQANGFKTSILQQFFSSNHVLAWFYFFRHIFLEQGVHFCFDVVLHHLRRVTKIYWHWWFLKRRLDTFTSDSLWVASFMNVRWKTVTVSLIKYSSTVGGGTLIKFNQKILKGRRNNT